MTSSPSVLVSRTDDNSIEDVQVTRGGRTLAMLGAGGPKRELDVARAFLEELRPNQLPVLVGAGAGYCLEALVAHCEKHGLPLLIIDKETEILEATGVQKDWERLSTASSTLSPTTSFRNSFKNSFKNSSGVSSGASSLPSFMTSSGSPSLPPSTPARIPSSISWITTPDVQEASTLLTQWQNEHGNKALKGCFLPFYQRLDKEYFGYLRQLCEASTKVNIWDKMRYPRFQGDTPRILLLTSRYFLTGEITAACARLGIPCQELTISDGEAHLEGFVKTLLETITRFKPDFVFTINHLGVDREGVLIDLLERIGLPLASWFVDNPMLILALYAKLVSPITSIFTWDHDNIGELKNLGFSHVEYLSLGTDTARFKPPSPSFTPNPDWRADVSFVGNSMLHKVASRLSRLTLPAILQETLSEAGEAFDMSEERSIPDFLATAFPELHTAYINLADAENQLGYQAALTWEATRQYRLKCVSATFPYNPLIVGDTGWEELIPAHVAWRKHSELTYYTDLPNFYPCSAINFNCTSKQMKGAVNQRVFDVPACGAFLLTDYREQVEELFEPGKEIICYHSPEEAQDLIRFYLDRPEERQKITTAARARILQEHSYDHRVRHLIQNMAQIYG